MHSSIKIKKIVNNFDKSICVQEIWDIGSRDGKDSLELARVFPNAIITAFEPNPTTFDSVQKIADSSSGRINAKKMALSDSDNASTIFYMIDTNSTLTSWEDGNPGASSLFRANNQIGFEKYVQTPIIVESFSAQTLIERKDCSLPDLLWMDSQGSEKLIFKGFGRYLSQVNLIYVELSFEQVYLNQPLADEVVQFLSQTFYWHSNLYVGELQFDALFINKNKAGISLFLRNLILKTSLNHLMRKTKSRSPLNLRVLSDLKKRVAIYVMNYL
jgi:FkbM family methyltransferase